ncbi:MAG: hypothetical protein QMD08_05855 [Actinomycetota bacterium]|nr:hypothetical protein [Actinomycetota bacterium]
MKYSTGRGTRMKHSTAMEWDEYEKRKKKRSRVKHSTGKGAAITHACGIELDMEEELELGEEAKQLQEKRAKQLLEKERSFDFAQDKQKTEGTKKSFNKVTIDY